MARTVENLEDSIYDHLRTVGMAKRAILQISTNISGEYPTDAALLIRIITQLTRSADRLLGDTNVLSDP